LRLVWPGSEDQGYLPSADMVGTWIEVESLDYIQGKNDGWIKPVHVEFNARHPLRELAYSYSRRTPREWAFDPLKKVEEPWRSNLHSFFVDLYSYSLAVPRERRPISIETIFTRSMTEGPAFAKWLDGAKADILGKYSDRKYFNNEIAVEYEMLQRPVVLTAGDIYRSNFLFYWKPPRESVSLYSMDNVCQDRKMLDFFTDLCRQFVSKLPKIEEIGYKSLLKSSSKGTFSGINALQKFSRPAEYRGRSRIAFVDRELKCARTACVEDIDSVIRIRWIEINLSTMLRDKRNGMKMRPMDIRSRMKKNLFYSYCRDFKKEGLTKPRNLIRIMLRELKESTGFASFDCENFFDEWVVEEGDKVYKTLRGHGLGMANSLTTMMQIILEEMVSKICNVAVVDSLYCNDDAWISLKSDADARNYSGTDRFVCEQLGLKFKEKASFVAKGEGVFCEQYVRQGDQSYSDKESHHYMAFYNLIKCANVADAKERASCVDYARVPKAFMKDIMDYWGWILFRNEFTRASLLGGWFKQLDGSTNYVYVNKFKDDFLGREEFAARKAYQEIKLEHFPWEKRSVKERLYDYFSEEFLACSEIKPFLEAKEIRRVSFDPFEYKRGWDKYLEKLKKSFSNWQKAYDLLGNRMTYGEAYLEDEKANPMIDFIPPKGMRTEELRNEVVYEWSTGFQHPYKGFGIEKNQNLFNSSEGDNRYNLINRCAYIQLGNSHVPGEKANWDSAKRRAIQLGVQLKNWEAFILPNDSDMNYFHNPFDYLSFCDRYGSEYKILLPDHVPEEKRKILDLRKRYYGRELTVKEWMEIGSLSQYSQIALHKLRNFWKEDEWLYAELLKLLRQYPDWGSTLTLEPENELWLKKLFKSYMAQEKFKRRKPPESFPPLSLLPEEPKVKISYMGSIDEDPDSDDELGFEDEASFASGVEDEIFFPLLHSQV